MLKRLLTVLLLCFISDILPVWAQTLSFEPAQDSLIEKNLTLRVKYLQAKGANSEQVNELLMGKVSDFFAMGEEKPAKPIKTQNLFAIVKKSNADSYESPEELGADWEIDFDMWLSYEGKTFVSIAYAVYYNTGGAHPNAHVGFLNIDRKTGKLLSPAELMDINQVKPMVEKAFQKQWKDVLEGSTDYAEKGFFIEENQFPMPQEIGFSKTELVFYYNNYEVAPYVMGATELRISQKQLAKLIKLK